MGKINEIKSLDQELLGSILEESLNAVIVRDFDTYEVLYANREARKINTEIGQLKRNCKCYEFLKRFDAPCNFCPAKQLNFEKYDEDIFDSEVTGKHYRIRGKLFHWNEKIVHVEVLLDDTKSHSKHEELRDLTSKIPGGIGIFNVYKLPVYFK